MDSLTHIAIGACIGDAVAGKKLGKKAMVWGALGNSLPDLDFIASFWLSMDENLLAHRGITHSFLFITLLTPLLAWLGYRWHQSRGISFLAWIIFFLIQLACHLFIDAFNNYGIGWLEPFSVRRFSFNMIYVFDLFFSIAPIVAMIALIVLRTPHHRRKFWWRLGLIAPAVYLAYCGYNKMRVNSEVTRIMQQQQIPYDRYFTTPTPFNSWLWYVVAATDTGLYTGYRSVFDSQDTMRFGYIAKNAEWLHELTDKNDLRAVKNLKRFSQGYFTVQRWNDTLVFNDLRFGQIAGWHDPDEKFVFHYFVQHKGNTLAVQRGRFARWNRETIRSLIRRIRGN